MQRGTLRLKVGEWDLFVYLNKTNTKKTESVLLSSLQNPKVNYIYLATLAGIAINQRETKQNKNLS